MLRVYISYFYQVRNFRRNLLPISTAISDPFWFHAGYKKEYVFLDKRGVVNGLRFEALSPDHRCSGECKGRSDCEDDPKHCDFLKHYGEQLSKINFSQFTKELEGMAKRTQKRFALDKVEVALLVHEAPWNPCSERKVLQHWFEENGYQLEEFTLREDEKC